MIDISKLSPELIAKLPQELIDMIEEQKKDTARENVHEILDNITQQRVFICKCDSSSITTICRNKHGVCNTHTYNRTGKAGEFEEVDIGKIVDIYKLNEMLEVADMKCILVMKKCDFGWWYIDDYIDELCGLPFDAVEEICLLYHELRVDLPIDPYMKNLLLVSDTTYRQIASTAIMIKHLRK